MHNDSQLSQYRAHLFHTDSVCSRDLFKKSPVGSVYTLKNRLDNKAIRAYISSALINHLNHHNLLGVSFSFPGFNPTLFNSIGLSYVEDPQVLENYIDYIANSDYLDLNVFRALFHAQGKKLLLFYDHRGYNALVELSFEEFNPSDNNFFLVSSPNAELSFMTAPEFFFKFSIIRLRQMETRSMQFFSPSLAAWVPNFQESTHLVGNAYR